MQVLLSLGSNLGNESGGTSDGRWAHLRAAAAALRALPEVHALAFSPIYETPPWGDVVGGLPSPAYLNACALLQTTLPPAALLGACLGIEAALGRQRNAAHQFAPRTIDLDVLFAVQDGIIVQLNDAYLTLPHPRLAQRAFALKPALQLWAHPQLQAWFAQPDVQADALSVVECEGKL